MKIAVVGLGYVGLSNALLLSQREEVMAYDIMKSKVDMLKNGESPIVDKDITLFLKEKKLNLNFSNSLKQTVKDAEYCIISTPTDYDEKQNFFDTKSVENVINDVLKINKNVVFIIKSTIPVGFTEKLRKKYLYTNIIFSPEFLREGKALHDNLYPTRIIVGDYTNEAIKFANMLKDNSYIEDVPIVYTNSTEAEAIKLFANTYLALRVSYFNELDTYAELKGLNTEKIIKGVSLDPRIGNHYNNPSFGYGGYCLPKDTKQLKANFEDVPNNIISAIVDSNETRKTFITEQIIKKNPEIVGIYRLVMKKDSDNFRYSSIQSKMNNLSEKNIKIIIYEPTMSGEKFNNFELINDLEEFKCKSDIILANRHDKGLENVEAKVYSRDIFRRD